MNITVAICEDFTDESEYLSKLLQSWMQVTGHTLNISVFSSAERFWSAYEDGFRPELLLLDSFMMMCRWSLSPAILTTWPKAMTLPPCTIC